MDVLSGGRIALGVGAGWLREEFEALGAPPFEQRGAVTDEYLRAFRVLWTEDLPRFDGKFVKFDNIDFNPKPVQNPLPVWVGGESGPAMRRAAWPWRRLGSDRHQPEEPARYAGALPGVEKLRGMVREAGRDPGNFGLAYRVQTFGEKLPDKADDGERRLFSGGAQDIAADLRAFRDLGVAQVDFGFAAGTEEDTLARMRRFREDVVARL